LRESCRKSRREKSVSKLQGGGRVSFGLQLSRKIQPLSCHFISPNLKFKSAEPFGVKPDKELCGLKPL